MKLAFSAIVVVCSVVLVACGGTSTTPEGADTGAAQGADAATAQADTGAVDPGTDAATSTAPDASSASPDAGTATGGWAAVPTGSTRDLQRLAYSGTQYVVTASGATAITSPDRVTWTERTPDPRVNWVRGITWSGTLFAVLGAWGGDYAQMSTSVDGITWKPGAIKMPRESVVWSQPQAQFVAVGTKGTVATSPDATTWTDRVSNVTEDLNRVIWTGTQFVAIGKTCTIATSPDGVAWTKQDPKAGMGRNNDLVGVATSGTTLVIVGGMGIVLTSADGVTWADHTLADPTTHQLKGVAWSGKEFVAVGASGSFPNLGAALYTSTDGASWTQTLVLPDKSAGAAFNDVLWDGARFLAVGNAGLLYTSN